MAKHILVVAVMFFSLMCGFAQTTLPESNRRGLQLGVAGGMSAPLGEYATYFAAGWFAELSGAWPLPGLFRPTLAAGYAGIPLLAGPRVDLGSLEAGGTLSIPFGKVFAARGTLRAGGYVAALFDTTTLTYDTEPSFGASASADLAFTFSGIKNLEVELAAGYRNYFAVWDGIEGRLSATLSLPPPKAKPSGLQRFEPLSTGGLSVEQAEFGNIFPVFFKYYNSHSIGKAFLVNTEKVPVTDVAVTFYMKQYMDAPKVCANIPKLEAGEKVPIELQALFTDKMLEITEGTMVAADIGLGYKVGDQAVLSTTSQAVRILDRNAMSWFDDRCVAAYVTAKDPAILTFAKNVAATIKGEANATVNASFQTALAIHQALDLFGLKYVVDPKSSYSSTSTNKEAVDFLQFPRQTLEYRAGDCDDLTILYSALLESVGIETAFLTIPGHIFTAFSLDITPDEARKAFSRADELIMRGDRAWVPVEITDRSGGFLAAWQAGAKEWRENAARDQARIYPTHEAWTVFEPVGLPGAAAAIGPPSGEAILARWRSELGKYVDREISPQVAALQAEVQKTQGGSKQVNALGVLYARFGQYDKAETEFQKNLKIGEYVPSLLNLGNIYYVRKKVDSALAYFERAYKIEPKNSLAILALARCNHDTENYGLVKKLYAELSALNPDLAKKFAYLDLKGEEAARAVDTSKAKELVEWAE